MNHFLLNLWMPLLIVLGFLLCVSFAAKWIIKNKIKEIQFRFACPHCEEEIIKDARTVVEEI